MTDHCLTLTTKTMHPTRAREACGVALVEPQRLNVMTDWWGG